MVARRRRGHRKPLTPEQQQLAERYIPLARSRALPYKRHWPNEWEEFESAALLALVEAAESFDAGRGPRFSAFARFRIDGALRDTLRRLGRQKWDVDGAGHSAFDHDRPASVEPLGVVLNTTPDPEVGMDLAESDAFERWMRRLPARHAAVCRALYRDGCNQAEVVRRGGGSQSRVCAVHKQSLALLRDDLEARACAHRAADAG